MLVLPCVRCERVSWVVVAARTNGSSDLVISIEYEEPLVLIDGEGYSGFFGSE